MRWQFKLVNSGWCFERLNAYVTYTEASGVNVRGPFYSTHLYGDKSSRHTTIHQARAGVPTQTCLHSHPEGVPNLRWCLLLTLALQAWHGLAGCRVLNSNLAIQDFCCFNAKGVATWSCHCMEASIGFILWYIMTISQSRICVWARSSASWSGIVGKDNKCSRAARLKVRCSSGIQDRSDHCPAMILLLAMVNF